MNRIFSHRILPICFLSLAAISRIFAEPFWQDVHPVMTTQWTSDVKPDKVWPEYPRPQMARIDWLNLNGPWDYTVGK